MELIAAKVRGAEAEFEIEQYRGKAKQLSRQLQRLGGSSIEQAMRTTNMEVALAKALSESAELRATNAALAEDVKGLIELRLELAELKQAAADVSEE